MDEKVAKRVRNALNALNLASEKLLALTSDGESDFDAALLMACVTSAECTLLSLLV